MNSLLKYLDKIRILEIKSARAAEIDYKSLGFSRILFGLFFFVFAWEQFAWIATVPDAFYNPPDFSIAAFFNKFPSKGFFYIFDTLILLSALTTTIGFFTRFSTATWLCSSIIVLSFKYSFGKIDHGIMEQALLFTMLWANWGHSLSIDAYLKSKREKGQKDTRAKKVSLHLLTLFLAFGFFTAGFPKAFNWIDFDLATNGFLAWLYDGYYNLNRTHLLANLAIDIRPLWLWEFADYFAVIFEFGLIFARFGGMSLRVWLVIASIFHLANLLFLNISFLENISIYLCFVSWSRLFPNFTGRVEKKLMFVFGFIFMIIFIPFFIVEYDYIVGGIFTIVSGYSIQDPGTLITATIIWGATLGILLYELVSFRPNSEKLKTDN